MIPHRKNVRSSVLKEFMTTSIHVLCSNFKEIGLREVGTTTRKLTFGDKKVRNMRFFSPPSCVPLIDSTKSLQGSVPPDPTCPCKTSSKSVPVCRSYFRKWISCRRTTAFSAWIIYLPFPCAPL